MRNLLIILLVLGTMFSYGEVSEQRRFEILKALDEQTLGDVYMLPIEEKIFLKELREEFKKSGSIAPLVKEMLQIGDEELIQKVGKSYESSFDEIYFVKSKQPRLLEYMAPVLLIEEPAEIPRKGHDTIPCPNSVSAAMQMLELISVSWELPEEVKKWASDITGKWPYPRNTNAMLRSAMRLWWKENEKAIKARDWKSVKPGIKVVFPVSPGSDSALPKPLPEPTPQTQPKTPTKEFQSKPVNEPKQQTISNTGLLKFIATLALTILAVLLVGMLRKKVK
jgi:hypothetical protein